MREQSEFIKYTSAQGAVFQCKFDPAWTVIRADDTLFRFLGYSREEFAQRFDNRMAGVIHPDDLKAMTEIVMEQLKSSNLIFNENRLICKGGLVKWIWISAERMWDETGKAYFYCMFYDISRQKQIQEVLASNEQRYDAILAQTQDVVYEWNCESNDIYCSYNFEQRFGYRPPTHDFPQCMLDRAVIHPEDAEAFLEIYRSIQAGADSALGEFRVCAKQGEYLWCKVSAAAILDSEGGLRKVVGMLSDIDEQKRKILSVQEQVRRDALTGLYNRRATEEIVDEGLAGRPDLAALLVIDVDNFKGINDTFGHIFGDAVLGEMAGHLKHLVGPGDIAGRVGGDEFVVYLGNLGSRAEAEQQAGAIRAVFCRSFMEQGIRYEISASMGIAFWPEDGKNYIQLFEKADIAAYYSKTNGKNRVTTYRPGLEQSGGQMPRRAEVDGVAPHQKNFRENVYEYVFRIFYENRDTVHAVDLLLELVGKTFHQGRVCIYELDEGKKALYNTFEWCAEGVSTGRKAGGVSLSDPLWQEDAFDGEDIYQCGDTALLQEGGAGRDWLLDRGTRACLFCMVREAGELAAIVGFEDCTAPRSATPEERNTLSLIAQTISLFLLRARKQRSLERQKQFADRLLAHSTACLYAIDPETYRIIYANKSVCENMGGAHVGARCHEALRGLQKPCVDCPMLELHGEDDTVVRDIFHPKKGIWTETTAAKMEWENGEQVCLLSNTDITRYRAESARLAFLSESIPGGLFGGYLEEGLPLYYINKHMVEFLGYCSQEEFRRETGGLLIRCVDPEDRERLQLQLRAGREEQQARMRMRLKDGRIRWVMYWGRVVLAENGKPAVLCLCMDITAQVELENQLDLYRAASRGGAFQMRMDDDFTLLYGNDIFYQVHECTQEEMRARNGNRLREGMDAQDADRIHMLIRQALSAGRNSAEWEMPVITIRGHRRWLRVNVSIRRDSGGILLDGFVIDLTEQHGLQEELVHSGQRNRIVLDQCNLGVWEYDLATRRLVQTDTARRAYDMPALVENAPWPLIESGFIHPDSRQTLLELYENVHGGQRRGEADILLHTGDGVHWCWEHLAFTSLFDDAGRPVRAVVVGADVTQQKEAELRYQQELELWNALTEGVIASTRTNLTRDRTEYVQRNGTRQCDLPQNIAWDDLITLVGPGITLPEDRLRFETELSRKQLLAAYAAGKDEMTAEYRRTAPDGQLNWARASVRLTQAENGDLYAYGSIRDISKQKAMEQALRRRVEVDAVTGAYNRETAMEMMRAGIERGRREGESCALLLVNIDGFSRIMHQDGYQAADRVLKELGVLLQVKFFGEKVVGRLYGDELAVWLGESPDSQRVRETAEEIRQSMGAPCLFADLKMPVSVSIGIAFGGETDLEGLLSQAREALSAAKESGKNRCVVSAGAETFEDRDWMEESPAAFEGREAEGVLLRSAFALTSTQDFRMSMEQVLEALARYYKADRASLLELETPPRYGARYYDWIERDAAERRGVADETIRGVGGRWLELFGSQAPVAFDRLDRIRAEFPQACERLQRQGVDAAYALPLELDGRVIGLMGVNNPRRHQGDLSLLQALRYLVVNGLVKQQMQEEQTYLGHHDPLTGLLNRESYLSYLGSLNPESLLSMGVASVDINGLKRLNSQYGHAYGDRLVKTTAETLLCALDGGRVFRLAGDEFLVICENLTLDAFHRRLEAFRADMEEKYPLCIALGHVWADTDINPERLISHADERMLVDKQAHYRVSGRRGKHYDPAMLEKLVAELEEGRYHMYLQPKAEISTGKIEGAEALVRYIHPENGVIPPDRFIPQLEEGGVISNVDLFIFEQVCKTLRRWSIQGRRMIPVSLNFSRATLLESRLLERMEEIHSKYGVPKALIEIEITESVAGVERETMYQICGSLVQENYHLSLDDFGAKYSNLSILSAIPLHMLKLDKSLVNDLSTNPKTRVVVRNFLSACQELQIQSVAEGVETKEQLSILQALGCDYAQGYYFNKPIPLTEFEQNYL